VSKFEIGLQPSGKRPTVRPNVSSALLLGLVRRRKISFLSALANPTTRQQVHTHP